MPKKYKLNGYSGTAVAGKQIANEYFKGFFDLLNAATGSGIVTRIAYNTGSDAGTGTGTGFHDEANRFGKNAWACYRFNSTATRSWDWYFLIQFSSQSGNFGDAPGNPGLLNGDSAAQGANEGAIGIAAAAMVDNMGAATNPWNGTTGNDGNDSKGDPVWQTGSVGDRLFVLPRSNSPDGDHASSRENMAELYNSTTTGQTLTFNIVVSEDGLVFATSNGTIANTWNVGYVGTYQPAGFLSASIPTPLLMVVADQDGAAILPVNTSVGARDGNNTYEGGIAVDSDSIAFAIDRPDTVLFANTKSRPNKLFTGQRTYDEWAVVVLADDDEKEVKGFIGHINTDLYRESYGVTNGSLSLDQTRLPLGSLDSPFDTKVTIPWTGSASLPKSFKGREGETF